MLSIAKTDSNTHANSGADAAIIEQAEDESTLSLAPEELASLTTLMKQYDQVLVDIDALNERLQAFLAVESPPKVQSEQSA